MINNLAWFVSGGIAVWFSLIFGYSKTLYEASITDIVLCGVGVVTVIIYHLDRRDRQKDRVWQTNKSLLFALSRSLEENIYAMEYYYALESHGEGVLDMLPQFPEEPSKQDGQNFESSLNDLLYVYGDMLDSVFLTKAKTLDLNMKAIRDKVMITNEFENVDGYEAMLKELKSFRVDLKKLIREMSGV